MKLYNFTLHFKLEKSELKNLTDYFMKNSENYKNLADCVISLALHEIDKNKRR